MKTPGKEPNQVNIHEAKTHLFLSAASIWELAIKANLGRVKLPEPLDTFFGSRLAEDRIEELPVTHRHAIATAGLPGKHADPFDRLLVAQARCEGLMLVSADKRILAYGAGIMKAV